MAAWLFRIVLMNRGYNAIKRFEIEKGQQWPKESRYPINRISNYKE
jgi:hypothetical protein